MNQSLPSTNDKSSSKDQARIHTTETGASYQQWDLKKMVIVQFYATFLDFYVLLPISNLGIVVNLQGDQIQLAPSRQQVLALEPQKAFSLSL